MKFLSKIAEIYANLPELPQTTFIFPNRRAGLFFKRELLKYCQKVIFSPCVTDINSFAQSQSPLRKANDIQLLLMLYQSYVHVRSQHTDKVESLDAFIPFGLNLLADFNEIDKNLVDVESLFANISDLKKINDQSQFFSQEQIDALRTFWGNFQQNESENLSFKQEFISLWDDLLAIYTHFTETLLNQNLAYEGLIYRNVINNLIVEDSRLYCFIGFNHLTPSEYKILKFYQQAGVADFYFDYPTTYSQQSPLANSVAKYYKQNLKEFPSRYNYTQPTEQNEPNITIHSTPSASNQINIAASLLNNKDITTNNTAILLADESLMPSLIQQIPNNITKINITMGYPLYLTPIATLINHILSLQVESKSTQKEVTIYHKPLLNILSHSTIQAIYPTSSSEIINHITRGNYIRINQEQLHAIINSIKTDDNEKQFFIDLFSTHTTTDKLLNYLVDIITKLLTQTKQILIPTDIEFLHQYCLIINQLSSLIKDYESELTPSSLQLLLNRLANSLKVQFKGEPVEGMQIMGLLESRLLDFKNIILIGFNDSKIPGNKSVNSVIPYNLRRAHNLPTQEVTDAIQAYNFYRTLYYTQNLHLIYDSRSEGAQNEISRYYYQIKYLINLPLKYKNYTIQTNETELAIEQSEANCQLDEFSIAKLKASNLSASKLKDYIACPLRFYFSAILGIKQPNQINELGEPSLLGRIYHAAMELYYNRLEKNNLPPTPLKPAELNNLIIDAFEEESKKTKKPINTSGFNSLIFNLVSQFVGNTILFDIERYKTQPFANVKSEVFFKTQIEGLNFVAYIDRIDVSSDNIVNIIDYKTTNNKTTKKINIVELFNSPFSAYHEIFQVLLYCYIYKQQNPNAIVRPILYKIQSLKSQKDIQPITLFVPNQLRSSTLPSLDTDLSSLMDIKDCEEISVTSYDKIEVAFEWLLQKTLRNIINTNTLFTINPLDKKGNACTYCQFKNLCNHTPQK